VEEAERLSQRLLRALEQHEDRAYFADLEAHAALRLGSALARQGRKGEALPHLERAVELRTERQHPASPRLAEARTALAGLKR
jgi:Flp pilus assembly protein TadD